ncbi:MAG: discoidin domain-containing protein [bacterium]|nr:discoidin domain-containing protein [bacterium]
MKIGHAAIGKTVTLDTPADSAYPGKGASGLTDGLAGRADHVDPAWMGYLGRDLVATVDLGKSIAIGKLGARFLRKPPVGIYPPKLVVFEVSQDGKRFTKAGEAAPDATSCKPKPTTLIVATGKRSLRARYVRFRTVNVAKVPAGQKSAGIKAWMFVDELLVNPKDPK